MKPSPISRQFFLLPISMAMWPKQVLLIKKSYIAIFFCYGWLHEWTGSHPFPSSLKNFRLLEPHPESEPIKHPLSPRLAVENTADMNSEGQWLTLQFRISHFPPDKATKFSYAQWGGSSAAMSDYYPGRWVWPWLPLVASSLSPSSFFFFFSFSCSSNLRME